MGEKFRKTKSRMIRLSQFRETDTVVANIVSRVDRGEEAITEDPKVETDILANNRTNAVGGSRADTTKVEHRGGDSPGSRGTGEGERYRGDGGTGELPITSV